jgi:hypothetical protein
MTEAFKPKWMNRQKEGRDRFQVEFNESERALILEMQEAIQQSKDATALKQWAFLGWFAYSNHAKFMRYFRDTLLKNERNNKRLGVNIEVELNDKIHRLRELTGWKL